MWHANPSGVHGPFLRPVIPVARCCVERLPASRRIGRNERFDPRREREPGSFEGGFDAAHRPRPDTRPDVDAVVQCALRSAAVSAVAEDAVDPRQRFGPGAVEGKVDVNQRADAAERRNGGADDLAEFLLLMEFAAQRSSSDGRTRRTALRRAVTKI
jgi:hypothetical protein